jgi:hypothetical protein
MHKSRPLARVPALRGIRYFPVQHEGQGCRTGTYKCRERQDVESDRPSAADVGAVELRVARIRPVRHGIRTPVQRSGCCRRNTWFGCPNAAASSSPRDPSGWMDARRRKHFRSSRPDTASDCLTPARHPSYWVLANDIIACDFAVRLPHRDEALRQSLVQRRQAEQGTLDWSDCSTARLWGAPQRGTPQRLNHSRMR